MGFWDKFKTEVAPAAKTGRSVAADRLRVIVETENRLGRRLSQDTINRMKQEIMEVVSRYVRGVGVNDVNMTVRTEDQIEMLEMNINLPEER